MRGVVLILGVGIDICNLTRIAKKVKKLDSHFYNYILTEKEIKQYNIEKNFILYLTIRFAAKEAFYKAFNTPSQKYLVWKDIEILQDHKNLCKVNLSQKVKKYLKDFLPIKSKYNVSNSFAYKKDLVICTTIISYYKN